MINVLVFPCGSEIGLEIHAALSYCKNIVLVGVSSVSDHGALAYENHEQITANVKSDNLLDQLNELIEKWRIDVVFPAHDSVIFRLAQGAGELNAIVIAPEYEIAAICRNKNLTYDYLDAAYTPVRITGHGGPYPIFGKPAVGQGSVGAEIILDEIRHHQFNSCGAEYVFTEYLPGKEFTVDCISSCTGELLHIAPRERLRVKAGISVRTRPVQTNKGFHRIAVDIASKMRLKGAWFFQVKEDRQGVYKLLEVAPRVSGSMAVSRCLGVNYALLSVYAHLGIPFDVLPQQYSIVMDRALRSRFQIDFKYEKVYLDLDDTLIVKGRVHPVLIALLYQWAASNTPVILVTRHAKQPYATLEHYRIHAGLFFDICHVRDGSPKSACIDPAARAIFIDDSYRERKEVHEQLGLPVFDVDSVEQLLAPGH